MIRVLSAFAAAALLMPVVANAQGIGSHIKKRSDARHDLESRSGDPARRALDDLTACIVDKNTPFARAALQLGYGSSEQEAYVDDRLSGADRCNRRGARGPDVESGLTTSRGYVLRNSAFGFVGSLAENLVESDLGLQRGDSLGSARIEELMVVTTEAKTPYELFGVCIAQRHPGGVQTLLQTVPGSREETQHVEAFADIVGGCVPDGEQIEAEAGAIRAIAAVGLYRVVQAAEGAVTSSGQ